MVVLRVTNSGYESLRTILGVLKEDPNIGQKAVKIALTYALR